MHRPFSVQDWVSRSPEPAHNTPSSQRKPNSQVIPRTESVLGSYWLAHMHPDKCKPRAPGKWCYLKENRFAENSCGIFCMASLENPNWSRLPWIHRKGKGKTHSMHWSWLSDLFLWAPFPKKGKETALHNGQCQWLRRQAEAFSC